MASPIKKAKIYCVDPRYPKAVAAEEGTFNVTALGGSLWFVTNAAGQASILEQLHILDKLVDLEDIIVEDHYDSNGTHHGCKAYGALLNDDSKAAHIVNLIKARQILQGAGFTDKRVTLLLRDLGKNAVEEVTTEEEVPVATA